MDTSEPRAVAWAISLSRAIALVAIVVGAAVLFGWALDIERLPRILSGTGVMKPWSAFNFVCTGLALTFLHRSHADGERARRACRLLGLPVAIVGGLTLVEYLADVSLGFDALLFRDAVEATGLPWPGRMTPAAGFGFFALGAALLSMDRRLGWLPVHQVLALVPALAGLLGLLGYLYGPQSLLQVYAFASMALHTSILLLLLAGAIFFARPTEGLSRPIVSRSNGGAMARRVLPLALILPLALGWLRLKGQEAGLYDTSFGLTIFATGNILLFAGLVWLSAVRINRVDEAREAAAKSLVLSEARSRALYEHAADLILTVDRDGAIRFANPTARLVLGTPPLTGDTAPRRLADLVVSEDREALEAVLAAAVNQPDRPLAASDLRLTAADGSHRTFEVLVRNLLDNPHVGAILVNARDVTERRAAHQSLLESEERLTALFHQSPIPKLLLRQSDLRLVDVNAAFLELLGFTRAEVIDRTPEDIQTLAGPASAALSDRMRRGGPLRGEDLRLRRRDGRMVEVNATTALVPIRGVAHIYSILVDVTEARAAAAERRALEMRVEEDARQSQRMAALGTLAGGIAHDFNNLLAVISGNLQLIRHECDAEEAGAPGVGTPLANRSLLEIRHATDRAIDLTRRILTFARRPEPGARAHPQPAIRLQEPLREAMGLLRSTLPAQIELASAIDPEAPPTLLDATSVQQIVLNLGTNAAHAIGNRPGRIEVALRVVDADERVATQFPGGAPRRCVALSVTDDGCGIPDEVRPRIFEPFFTTKPAGQGTGLGLSVIHGIVHGLNGSIAVESPANPGDAQLRSGDGTATPRTGDADGRRGPGTTITLSLPPALDAEEHGAKREDAGPTGGSQRVMYVDDEEAMAWLTTRLLERRGYRVRAFSDPREALGAFLSEPDSFDLVITDGSMPGMSGHALAARLHGVRPELPIVLVSGYLTAESVDEARRCGIDEVLLKPGTVEELDRAIHAALARRQQPVA